MTNMDDWDYNFSKNYWINNKNHIINLKHPQYVNECIECYHDIMEDDNYTIHNENYYCERCNDNRIYLEQFLCDNSEKAQLTKEEEKLQKQRAKETEAKHKKIEAEEAKERKKNDKNMKEILKQKDNKDAEYNAKYTYDE
jgi:hypothetical protein